MNEDSFYVCPACKGTWRCLDDGLRCAACQITYPPLDGIPDFMPAELRLDPSDVVRNVGRMDRLARVL